MIIIKTGKEIEIMKKGGHHLAEIVKEVSLKARPDISTAELNELAEAMITRIGARPSFKGYKGYPAAICASVNDEIVHSIPSEEKILKNGDILGLDIGLEYEGMYTDMAVTVPVGKISKQAKRLINVTKKALELGLREVKPGKQIGDISYAIQNYAEANGYNVVRCLVGHGVGKEVHEEPKIPNYGESGTGPILEPGMAIAIEPMVTIGSSEVITDDDGWTARTEDGSLAAHFEVTVAITREGRLVITK